MWFCRGRRRFHLPRPYLSGEGTGVNSLSQAWRWVSQVAPPDLGSFSASTKLGCLSPKTAEGRWHALPRFVVQGGLPSWASWASCVLKVCPTAETPIGFTMNKPGWSKQSPFCRSDVKAWPIKGSVLWTNVLELFTGRCRKNFGLSLAPSFGVAFHCTSGRGRSGEAFGFQP